MLPNLDSPEGPIVAAVHRPENANGRGRIDLDDGVVNESLGGITDPIWKVLLVAVGGFVRDSNIEFRLRGANAIVETFQRPYATVGTGFGEADFLPIAGHSL